MRNPGGYRTITEADGTVSSETDTFTCKHCNGIVVVPTGAAPATVGAFCCSCGGHVCHPCEAKMNATLECAPFERWLDMKERSGRFRRLVG